MYSEKAVALCQKLTGELIKKGYKCVDWHMWGGFTGERYAEFTRPNGSKFWASTLKDLKQELVKC